MESILSLKIGIDWAGDPVVTFWQKLEIGFANRKINKNENLIGLQI
jgi:hypothetical protein